MRKLYKLSFVILIPLVLGLLLNMFGSGQVANIGRKMMSIGVPVTMLIIFVIGMVLMITGGLEEKHEEQPVGEREEEEAKIKDINTSYRYRSKLKQGNYLSGHISKIYKNSTTKEKILGWLFFAFLIIDFALIFVFLYSRNFTGIIVCFCIFCGTILIAIICKVITEKISKRVNLDKLGDKPVLRGVVEACYFSSSTSVGGAHSHSTTRITKVTYRVVIKLGEEKFNAYSEEFFETGDRVKFVLKTKKLASIVGKEENLLEE